MLSVLRRSLPTLSARRTLASLASTTNASSQVGTIDPEVLSETGNDKILTNEEGEAIASEYLSDVPPWHDNVHVSMSTLLHPKKGENIAEQIASLDPTVFNHPIRRDILHLCVVHYRDGLRQGTASSKSRGEVKASGHKLRPQKGSGRARLGDAGSPNLVGGGKAFGPKPRDFSTKLPRKVVEMGMRVALSAKLREERLGIVKSLAWPGLKTKHFAERLDNLGWRKALFVTGEEEVPIGLSRSSSNLRTVEVKTVNDLTVYDLVRWQRVILDAPAVEHLERTLTKLNNQHLGPIISDS